MYQQQQKGNLYPHHTTTTSTGYNEPPPPYYNNNNSNINLNSRPLGPPAGVIHQTNGGTHNGSFVSNSIPPPGMINGNHTANQINNNVHQSPPNSTITTNNNNTNNNLSQTKEVKLCNNNKDREMYDNLAELYSIIKVTEHLEKAYIRDSVLPKDYTTACSKLIAQFKSSQTLVKDNVPNINTFMRDYNLDCKAAYDRLVMKGYPSTLEHSVNTESNDFTNAKYVAETVQHFITTMDSVKLNCVAVDNIHPLLSDLLESLNRNTWLSNFEGKDKIISWMTTLNKMKASDELDENQARQLLFDLDSSYSAFYKSIKN